MKRYEAIFVFLPTLGADARKQVEQHLDGLVKKHDGQVVQKTDWGKRPLGYPIKKVREGLFLLMDFDLPTAKVQEFRKALELNEDVIKFMVTVKPPQPPVEENKPDPTAKVQEPAGQP